MSKISTVICNGVMILLLSMPAEVPEEAQLVQDSGVADIVPESIVADLSGTISLDEIIDDIDLSIDYADETNDKMNEKVLQEQAVVLNAEEMLEAVKNKTYEGFGYISWEGWSDIRKNGLLDAKLNLSLINDDVYTSMKLPSESTNYAMSYRCNGSIMDYENLQYDRACGIGAFYPVYGKSIPISYNLCVGKFRVYVLRENNNAWEELTTNPVLSDIKNIQLRPLPWSLDIDLDACRPMKKTVFHEDYVEFKLVNRDLKVTSDKPEGSVLHFYTDKISVDQKDVIAYVVIYEMWSDTPEINGNIVATVGLDCWGDECNQMFSGRSYLVSNEHRLVIGHNISDQLYQELVGKGLSPQICLDMYNKNN